MEMMNSETGTRLPADVLRAVSEISAYIDRLRTDVISKRILAAGLENLVGRLSEASRQQPNGPA
jgi:hypothetical protein